LLAQDLYVFCCDNFNSNGGGGFWLLYE
jgi:hypothetical protein